MKKYEQQNCEKKESESKGYKSEILNQDTTEMKEKARNVAKGNKHPNKNFLTQNILTLCIKSL